MCEEAFEYACDVILVSKRYEIGFDIIIKKIEIKMCSLFTGK